MLGTAAAAAAAVGPHELDDYMKNCFAGFFGGQLFFVTVNQLVIGLGGHLFFVTVNQLVIGL